MRRQAVIWMMITFTLMRQHNTYTERRMIGCDANQHTVLIGIVDIDGFAEPESRASANVLDECQCNAL